MSTTPVPVKQSAQMPDIWSSFRLFREMDRLLDRFTSGFATAQYPSIRFDTTVGVPPPAMDITEDEASFKLTAELPGLTEKDVQVALSSDTITIKGEKRQEREQKEKNYHLSERSYGEFQRSFVLPGGVDRDKVSAAFVNGVLTVTLPKTIPAAPKKIDVKPG